MSASRLNIFLSDAPAEVIEKRKILKQVLERAGMNVLTVKNKDDVEETDKLLEKADCSIHIFGGRYNFSTGKQEYKDAVTLQFELARNKINFSTDRDFKLFVWVPENDSEQEDTSLKSNIWRTIGNSLKGNMIMASQESPVMFVDDIRSIMFTEEKIIHSTKETEIFFIYNDLDEQDAIQILDLLSDVAKIESVKIVLSSDIDYESFVVQQIEKSDLAVIYFKNASEWAKYFGKQVWRQMGGASSDKALLIIGDEQIQANNELKEEFQEFNIKTLITSKELIPLEIKVELDKVKENKKA